MLIVFGGAFGVHFCKFGYWLELEGLEVLDNRALEVFWCTFEPYGRTMGPHRPLAINYVAPSM